MELPGALEADAVIGTGRRRLLLGALALWAALTIFSRLGGAPVYIINEGREGVYVRAMLDTGDWILPSVPNHVECGETIPDKPPLFHWIAGAATGVRGALASGRVLAGSELSRRFDEWTLRSPSAIAGVLMFLTVLVLSALAIRDDERRQRTVRLSWRGVGAMAGAGFALMWLPEVVPWPVPPPPIEVAFGREYLRRDTVQLRGSEQDAIRELRRVEPTGQRGVVAEVDEADRECDLPMRVGLDGLLEQ